MANEEDECDSSRLFPMASQSDVTSFLHDQATKIAGLNSCISDDDDDDNCERPSKSYLSHSCFASISTTSNSSDDLTELRWLNTFKLKELKDNEYSNNQNHITKLTNELKELNHENLSFDVMIFLALYSQSNTSWSLSLKQLYEYIQIHMKQIVHKRGWKNLVKETLITNPCFIQMKSRSIWTIDPYYRPLLMRAYENRLTIETKKSVSMNENDDKQINNMDNFPPKATVKTKALPRLYERLCEEQFDNEDIIKHQSTSFSDRKRPRSMSLLGYYQTVTDNDKNRFLSSSSWTTKLTKRPKVHSHDQSHSILKTSTLNKESTIITPCPSTDHMYLNAITKSNEFNDDDDDECDSNSLLNKTIVLTRSQTANRTNENDSFHRRKSSPPKKRLLSNTRINKKNIEQDLELLRKAINDPQIIIHSNQSKKISNEHILDLSLSR